MKKIFQVSVRDLVELTQSSGSLTYSFSASYRQVNAIRIHQKIQKSRGKDYQREVPVSFEKETDHFILEVNGRIDGILTLPDGIVIDEIKTTSVDPQLISSSSRKLHWAQAKCYAFIVARERKLEQVTVQLTYYHLDTRRITEIKHRYTMEELTQFMNSILDSYVEWANRIMEWRSVRDDSIREMDFPCESYRAGQKEMAEAVYETLQAGGQLLVQAPTGIGKSLAVLFPSIKTMGEGKAGKLLYLTARNTGKTAAATAFELLRAGGLRLKTLTMTAKEKICPREKERCFVDECEYAQGYYDRNRAAVEDAFQEDNLDGERILFFSQKHCVCPFELSLDLLPSMDCIIGDYNYAFDPHVSLKGLLFEGGEKVTLLVDEAHNLADRAREMFSAEIRRLQAAGLSRLLRRESRRVSTLLRNLCTAMDRGNEADAFSSASYAEREAPQGIFPALSKFLAGAEKQLVAESAFPHRPELLDFYFLVRRFMNCAEQFDEACATCYERMGKDFRVKIYCIDPSNRLCAALQRCQGAIFFSGTLLPIQYFKRICGCEESARTLLLPSPFPEENFRVLVNNRISTRYRVREFSKDAVASALDTFASRKEGNYLFYFPSYEYLSKVYDRFMSRNHQVETIRQVPGMEEKERRGFLDRFYRKNSKTLAGFAVMGGIFGEGIDLLGDRLIGAAIVGVGLPGMSIERGLIRDYFENSKGKGFEFAYLYPGLNRVLQAAGRVIRSETDRGAVLLIDERFGSSSYRSLFPVDWRPVAIRSDEHFQMQLKEFWFSRREEQKILLSGHNDTKID